ncbi:high-affinity glucose transporter RGT2, partial [Cladorrhinum samala]
ALLLCLASLGGLLFGYDTGYISGVMAMDYFIRTAQSQLEGSDSYPEGSLPQWNKLLVVGMLSIGTAFGSLVGSDLADYLGRRVTLIIGTALFLVGVTDELASKHLESLTRGRFETGIAVGVITGVIVVYLTEIAPAHARGYVTCVFQFSVTVGLLFSSCMTMATRKFWGPESYRVPIGLQFLWGTGLLAGLLSLPESPRWYVKVGRVRRAKLALMSLIGVPIPAKGEEWPKDPRVEEEMEDILFNRNARLAAEAHVTADEADEDLTVSRYYLSWKKCFQGPWSQPSCSAKRTLFGAALMMFQQVTGINFIFYFGATFFKQQGFSNSFVVIVGLTTVNVVSTTVSLIMVPTVRRRPLLMSGAAAMALCQLTVGLIYGTAQHPQHAPEWLTFTTMIGVSIYIFSYAATWGPGAWTLLGEIFPMETRSRSIGIATATNWIFNSIACFITPLMVERDHGGLGMWVFLIWCGTSIGALAFVYLFVPETYGRTLEEI